MIRTGLVSITFRKLSCREVVDLVAAAGMDGIEWGGDVHVPHGDLQRAHDVAAMTTDAGLAVPSYGSYYRVGHHEPCPFEAVVETAAALGAPLIRVWAGKQGSAAADDEYRRLVADEMCRIADLAAGADMRVACEWHNNTLTDTNESAFALLDAVDRQNVRCYWQPTPGMGERERLAGLLGLIERGKLAHVHAYQWEGHDRLSLAEGADRWEGFCRPVAEDAEEHFVMMEFVAGDGPEQFVADAETLKRIVAAVS